jgi:predicted transcriptional regulator
LSAIGELESEVLEVLQDHKGPSTVGDVLNVLRKRRDVAYTTISTTLDRLHKKKLVERSAIPGRGGTKYLFTIGRNEKLKNSIIQSSLDRLTGAFGDMTYSTLYRNVNSLSQSDLERLKKQVDKALKAREKKDGD